MRNNVTQYKHENITLDVETQSLFIRIFDKLRGEQIGVCAIESAEVGHGVIKMLFVDSAHRHHSKEIFKSIENVAVRHGFRICRGQRKKQNGFVDICRKVV